MKKEIKFVVYQNGEFTYYVGYGKTKKELIERYQRYKRLKERYAKLREDN